MEFAPLASHTWQSTLFAAAAVLLTFALRRNQARVRYAVLLAASYKFLFPSSWLVSLGREFQWRTAAAALPHAVATVTDVISAKGGSKLKEVPPPEPGAPPPGVAITPDHLPTAPPGESYVMMMNGFAILSANGVPMASLVDQL